jgi:heme exporter protein C
MRGVRGLDRTTAVSTAAVLLLGAALGLIFFYVPTDADQGFSQRIFYFHVPIALTSYACFGWGAWKALRYLRTRDERADLESYVAIHQGVIFGALTLVTGSIWARASWGVWWSCGENPLVLFLALLLSYCAYSTPRFSVDAGPARMNMSAVYALFGVVLIPVSFLAIRLSQRFIHPVVFDSHAPSNMTGSQWLAFLASFAAMLLLFATLYNVELAGKRIDAHLRELRELLGRRLDGGPRRAQAPALPAPERESA